MNMIAGYFRGYLMDAKPYYWKRPFHKTAIELYRCEPDGVLLTDNLMAKGHCAGHRIRQPATPTLVELALIYLGIIQ